MNRARDHGEANMSDRFVGVRRKRGQFEEASGGVAGGVDLGDWEELVVVMR